MSTSATVKIMSVAWNIPIRFQSELIFWLDQSKEQLFLLSKSIIFVLFLLQFSKARDSCDMEK